MNPIAKYWQAIESGEVIVCTKVRKTIEHLYNATLETDSEFHYDDFRAEHVIQFFEKYLRHSKGKWGGQLIRLEDWQKAFLAALFGFVDADEVRQYQRAILIVGKKNGKSLMSSGVGLYALTADGEPGAEVYAVATTRDQAKIIWSEAKRMRNKSPILNKRLRTTISEIAYDDKDGTFRPLASNEDTLDGLNVSCALMDEFQQWRHGRALYDIIADGITSREQPIILMTSTAGKVREDIYDEIYEEASRIINGYGDDSGYRDTRTLALVYELDDRREWTDPNMWIKANPNLGVSKSVKALAEKVERAKLNPSQVKNLLTKEFNIRETAGETWLSFEAIDNRNKFDLSELKPDYAIAGVDLSKTTDLTAAVVIFNRADDVNTYALPMFWMPADLVQRRVEEDRVPYDKWIDQGYLRTCEGNVIDYKCIVAWFEELRDDYDLYLSWIGYDAWSAQYFVDELKSRYGDYVLEKVHQGKQTLSAPMFTLGADLQAHRVIYNNNPVLKWCMTNVAIDVDKNGNIQPIKSVSTRQRIDGFSALLDAYVARDRHYDEYINLIGGTA